MLSSLQFYGNAIPLSSGHIKNIVNIEKLLKKVDTKFMILDSFHCYVHHSWKLSKTWKKKVMHVLLKNMKFPDMMLSSITLEIRFMSKYAMNSFWRSFMQTKTSSMLNHRKSLQILKGLLENLWFCAKEKDGKIRENLLLTFWITTISKEKLSKLET